MTELKKPKKSAEKESYEHIEKSLEDPDFKRHVSEVAIKTGLPEDVVERVLRHYFKTVMKVIFSFKNMYKRITLIAIGSIEVRPFHKKNRK